MLALEQGGEAWLHFFESNMSVPAGMKSRQLANDFRSLIALWKNPFQWRDEIEPLLPVFPYPCLLYAGDGESSYMGMKAGSLEMPHAEFISLPGSGHFDIWMEPEKIISSAIRFLKS